jgi:hypothetical protein
MLGPLLRLGSRGDGAAVWETCRAVFSDRGGVSVQGYAVSLAAAALAVLAGTATSWSRGSRSLGPGAERSEEMNELEVAAMFAGEWIEIGVLV